MAENEIRPDYRLLAVKLEDYPAICDYCGGKVWWGWTYKNKRATFSEDWTVHLGSCPGFRETMTDPRARAYYRSTRQPERDFTALIKLYEQHIALTIPSEHLHDMAQVASTAPQECIQHAFEIMARRKIRSWPYARAIIRRHAEEGCPKEDRYTKAQDDYAAGKRQFGREREINGQLEGL